MCFDWLDFQTSFSHLPYDFILLLIVTMFLEVLDPPPPPKNAATSNKQCNINAYNIRALDAIGGQYGSNLIVP